MADDPKPGVTPENQNPTPDDQQDDPTPEVKDPAAREALRKEREARRAADKRAKDAETRAAEYERKQTEADAARAKADQDEALKRGEHEQVIATLTTEKQTLEERLTAAETRLAGIDAKTKARIEAGVKDLPEDLTAFDPGADAPLESRVTWFEKASEIAGKRQSSAVRAPMTPQSNVRTPKPEIKSLVSPSSA